MARGTRCLALAAALAVGLLFFRPQRPQHGVRRTVAPRTSPSRAAAPPPLDLDEAAQQPPAADDGHPESLSCALYAGPLRWRRHPAGKGAPARSLRGLRLGGRPALSAARRALVGFRGRDVQLLPGSPFATAASTNAAFLRLLSVDRLFFSFRATAGLRQPKGVRPYGGWESPGAGIRGHFVGHYLSALASAGGGGDAAMVGLASQSLAIMEECARAHAAKGLGGYLSAFPPAEFDKVETLTHGKQMNAWVPHYAVQKVLTGLVTLHIELPRLAASLPLALGMASYVWDRAARLRAAKGPAHWAEGLNYEVGALSEVYVQLAVLTGNRSWLDAAALFDRDCFSAPLALAGSLHAKPRRRGSAEESGQASGLAVGGARAGGAHAGGAWQQSAEEAAAADSAMVGMHSNAHLAFVLGNAARYEATGESRARFVVEAFWRALQAAHTYLAGGSSFQEEWKVARAMGTSLEHRGRSNWAAHDHQESCVTHHSMQISRKILGWGGATAESWQAELLAHAEWLDTSMYNGVLGTQRGVQPGALLYMLPLGGGVSKAGGNHGYSDGEHHFWCCVGSAVEAFTRLAASVFYRRPRHVERSRAAASASSTPSTDAPQGTDTSPGPVEAAPELVVLQLISSELTWARANCIVALHADAPGELRAGLPLQATLTPRSLDAGAAPCTLRLRLRVPAWSQASHAELTSLQLLPPKGSPKGRCPAPLLLSHKPASDVKGVSPPGSALWLSRPPQPPASITRRGGSDGVNAASWRIVPLSPADEAAPVAAAVAAGVEVLIEPFDRPGMALTNAGGTVRIAPLPAGYSLRALGAAARSSGVPPYPVTPSAVPPNQRWRLRTPVAEAIAKADASTCGDETDDLPSASTADTASTYKCGGADGFACVGEDSRSSGGGMAEAIGMYDEPPPPPPPQPRSGPADPNPTASTMVALQSAAAGGAWLSAGAEGALIAADARSADGAAVLRLRSPLAQFPPLAFWAHSNGTASDKDSRSSYLMVPLRDIIDETYSAHLCVLPPGAPAPHFCR